MNESNLRAWRRVGVAFVGCGLVWSWGCQDAPLDPTDQNAGAPPSMMSTSGTMPLPGGMTPSGTLAGMTPSNAGEQVSGAQVITPPPTAGDLIAAGAVVEAGEFGGVEGGVEGGEGVSGEGVISGGFEVAGDLIAGGEITGGEVGGAPSGGESPAGEMGVAGEPAGEVPPIELPETCSGPLELPIAGCSPAPLPSTGDLYEDCVRRINQLRTVCQCLPPLERWLDGESCADAHAEYDAMTGQAHSGFREQICSPGGRGQNECPGYRSEDQVITTCLQQMWDEGPGEPFSQHGHYINMTNPSHQRVACGFFTTSQGAVWAIQNFSP